MNLKSNKVNVIQILPGGVEPERQRQKSHWMKMVNLYVTQKKIL